MMLTQSKPLELQKGIQLLLSPKLDPGHSRVWLSSGVTQEIESPADPIPYCLNAFVPKEPWREPGQAESNLLGINGLLSNKSKWDLGSSIGVCRFPDEALAPLIALLDQLGIRSRALQSYEHEYKRVRKHPDYEAVIASVIKHLSPYYRYPHQPKPLGVYAKQPGLRTSTTDVDYSIDSSERFRIGMHLDSHDRLPLRRRHQSRNRICINLGCEDRFFLFINLTLMDMFNALGLSEPEDFYQHYRGVSIGREFMKRHPSYPVIKLKIAPGEAYIAPTDNLIHDGSSVGKQYPDIVLTFLGYFGIPL